MYRLTVSIEEEERQVVLAAATWLERFYPGVKATVGDLTIDLTAPDHDEQRLRLIWIASLRTEYFGEAHARQRRNILQGLLA